MRAKKVFDQSEQWSFGRIAINCPACETIHILNTKPGNGPTWAFDNNFDRPTVSPSLLARAGKHVPGSVYYKNPKTEEEKEWNQHMEETASRCHSFIKAGRIQFLSDCTHKLKGQTVDLPEFED